MRTTERFYELMFLVAAWHNFLGGALLAGFGNWIYTTAGLTPPTPGIHYVTWIGLIFVFGIMYYMIYSDMYGSKRLVIIGVLGKFLSASPMVYGLLASTVDIPALFIIPIITDLGFGVLFIAFLVHGSRAGRWQ